MLVLELRFLCWAQVSAYSQCVGGVAAALGIGLQSAPATSRGAQFIATPNTQKFKTPDSSIFKSKKKAKSIQKASMRSFRAFWGAIWIKITWRTRWA